MKKIWSIFDRSKKIELFIFSFFMSVYTALEAISISLLLPIIVSLTDNNFFDLYPRFSLFLNFFQEKFSTNMINTTLILFGSILIFKNLFQIYVDYRENFLITKTQEEISQKLFNRFIYRDYNFHLNSKSADLITKIRNETRYFGEGVFSFLRILTELILISGISILLFIIAFKITLLSIILSIIFSYIFIKIFNKYIVQTSRNRLDIDYKKTQLVQESILGIREIIISNIFRQVSETYKFFSNSFIKSYTLYSTILKIPKIYFELIVLFGLISVIYISANYFPDFSSQLILPTLGIYAASAFKILPAINRIVGAIQRFKFASPVIDQVYEDLKGKKFEITNSKIIDIQEIEIKNLSFSYKNPQKKIFENINLKINFGDKILIIGDSGIGKSTFLDLLVGLQDPDSGKIIVNRNFELSKKLNLTNSLSYVSQKVFIFNKSLKNNICLSSTNIDENKIKKSIKISNLEQVILKLPNGIHTELGESGSILSGGQKQRIMIARAIYKSENFIILDEPTSSLDLKTADIIIKNLTDRKNTTLLMVTHNKNFKKYFSRVLEIKEKELIEHK
tara:strand:+ start:682 stop:2379 length:1698 start_codon:yes stop_codon:yes gene_type:complete